MKKLFSFILTISLSVCFILPLSTSTAADLTFPDVNSDHWAYSDIMTLANSGVVNGYEDGEFRPEGNLTRAEMAKIVVLAFDLNSYKAFSDETWFSEWLQSYDDSLWWKEYSVRVRDYFANNGHQKNPITDGYTAIRRDVAHVLVNALNPNYQRDWTISGYNLPNNIFDDDSYNHRMINTNDDNPLFSVFTDMKDWVYGIQGYDPSLGGFYGSGYFDTPEHVYIAAKIGLVDGYPEGDFRPYGDITRAEFCTMVNRALSLRGNLPAEVLL
ncbi:MAG: S-layer homology domain-containing protein [Clostridiales bacterium]|jgi:hypothetical protein|nr:S-layer homology domain-containing protein [Clostridiales bacterium]